MWDLTVHTLSESNVLVGIPSSVHLPLGLSIPHPYREYFICLSNWRENSQSTPFGVQHPRWHSSGVHLPLELSVPHPYRECFVPLSNWCEISQSTPFGVQHPRWHSSGVHLPLELSVPHPYRECFVPLSNWCEISQSTPFGAQHPRWRSSLSPIDVGSHNSPPLGPNILAGTRSGVHLHSGLSVLAGTPPNVYPL